MMLRLCRVEGLSVSGITRASVSMGCEILTDADNYARVLAGAKWQESGDESSQRVLFGIQRSS
jgi:hypothetical protein